GHDRDRRVGPGARAMARIPAASRAAGLSGDPRRLRADGGGRGGTRPRGRPHRARCPARRPVADRDAPRSPGPGRGPPPKSGATETRVRAKPTTALAITLAPTLLAIIAEAAWISVVSGLVQVFGLRMPDVGVPALAVVVAIGAIAARTVGPRLGARWPFAAFALVALAAAAGWLASPEARAALPEGIGPSLAAHPGGLLVGLAMLRGFAHARIPPAA